MTSGGYRSVSPRATVARFRKHVSPLTGVVSRLERIDADLPMNTNYLATHNFSAPPRDGRRAQGGTERRQLRQGQHCRTGRSQRAHGGDRALFRNFSGRRDQSDAAVHGFPAGRRHSSERRAAATATRSSGEIRRRRTARTRRRRCRLRSIDRPRSNGRRSGRCATSGSNIFRPACCIFSTGALPATRSTRIPTAARPATRSRKRSSRDSSSWWSGMPTRSGGTTDCSGRKWTSTSSTIPTSAICKAQLAETGRRLWLLDVTSDLGIPTFVAIAHWMENGAGIRRVRFRRALRCAHRRVARDDRAQSISVHRPHGRPEPNRRAENPSSRP